MVQAQQLNYRQTVALLEEERERHLSPVSGIIESATIHWPLGCNSLLEVIVNHGTIQVLPTTRGGIALNDATRTFHIGEPVIKDDIIEVVFINHDDTNPHTPTAIVYVREKKTEEAT